MKRIFLLFLCTCFICGCASKDDGRVTITYQTMETLPQQRKLLEELIGRFHQKYPTIKVKVQTSTTGFQKLNAQFAGGNVPDVFYYVSDRLFGFVYKNGILNLKPFIDQDPEVALDKYFPQTVDACSVKNGIYLMPVHFSTDVLFYNKDIFDKNNEPYPSADWTWEKYREIAEKLTVKGSGGRVQYGTLQPRPTLVLKSFGTEFFDEGLTHSLIDSIAARNALQYIKSLSDKKIVPSQAQIRDIEVMDGVTLFSTGQIAMLIGRTYMLVEFGAINGFEWDVAPVPMGARRYSRLAVGGNCISSAAAHPKEAWELVKFLSSEEAVRIAAKWRNCVPAIKSVAESDVFLHTPPKNVAVFVDSIKDSGMENPRMMNWFEYVDKVIQMDTERVIYDQMSIEDAVSDIKRSGDAMLKEETGK